MDRIQINSNLIDSGTTDFNVSLRLGEDFATNLFQESLYGKSYAERVQDESINDIIDYEKQIFYPSYLTKNILFDSETHSFINEGNLVRVKGNNGVETSNLDDYMRDVKNITFNLYFRQRLPINDPEKDGYVDYGSWQSSDELYWNSFAIDPSGDTLNTVSVNFTDCGDLLGFLGFDDNDVFYQKKALKKSFLRISVYDTPYRQTQKLLFYSTIFFDTNKLYKKYTTLLEHDSIRNVDTSKKEYTYTIAAPLTDSLATTFTATSKYNNEASSDGFYLYLFDKIVKANQATPLYLKFEFNNAKYGKTVAMVSPRDGYFNEINPVGSSQFPINYVEEDTVGSSTIQRVNMDRLYHDMYLPIFVRYNHKTRHFEWTIASKRQTTDGNITINLYEPRINELTAYEEYAGLMFTAVGDSTIALENYGGNMPYLEFSLNKGHIWEEWDYSPITVADGQTVCFRGNNANGFSFNANKYSQFVMTGSFTANGSVMALLDEYGYMEHIPNSSCFYRLFYECEGLLNTPSLPATTLANYCYDYMFAGCTNLTTAPELPATNLAYGCYNSMFWHCTNLTSVPQNMLPATTLVPWCYEFMFNGCTNLINTPELPATTLAEGCYFSMFSGCKKLTSVPLLSATTLAEMCYYYMFMNCEGITTVPQDMLPATTLADYCYQYMFQGCTNLTNVPTLPAVNLTRFCYAYMFYGCSSLETVPDDLLPSTTLAVQCYGGMFYNCSSLEKAPVLPALTLHSACYVSMFNGCSSLNYIKCLATDISASSCTTDWVKNVANNGTFIQNPAMEDWTIGNNGIPTNWTIRDTYYEKYLTLEILTSGTIGWKLYGTNSKTISYSINNGNWTDITSTTAGATISVNQGDLVRLKGNNSTYATARDRYSGFEGGTSSFNISGNIMSLIYEDNFKFNDTLSQQWVFSSLFKASNVISAEHMILPANSLPRHSYRAMFSFATSLVTPPKLPATSLEQNCYWYMFESCAITTAPALPSTTLKINCYGYMFKDCTSLENAPELPAESLVNTCYIGMFQGCSSLNKIKCYAKNIGVTNPTQNWVNGVKNTSSDRGLFIRQPSSEMSTDWARGVSGIPSQWNTEDIS